MDRCENEISYLDLVAKSYIQPLSDYRLRQHGSHTLTREIVTMNICDESLFIHICVELSGSLTQYKEYVSSVRDMY